MYGVKYLTVYSTKKTFQNLWSRNYLIQKLVLV